MSKVLLGATMSLNGFINDRSGSVAPLYPDLGAWRDTEIGRETIQLERLQVLALPGGRTHLRFRVVK